MKSDKQRGEHVYPVLEMLNNEIKSLKLEKIKFENLEKKMRKIRHLPANHPLQPTTGETLNDSAGNLTSFCHTPTKPFSAEGVGIYMI